MSINLKEITISESNTTMNKLTTSILAAVGMLSCVPVKTGASP